jgi:hypothetical protein
MSRLGPEEMAEVLQVQAGEMHRIWRLARHSIQPDLLPGLSDAVMDSFFAALGPALARGAAPEAPVAALRGVLRIPPAGGDAVLAEEWAVARQVLRAACESLGASEEVEHWLDRAGMASEEATALARLGAPGAPRGVVAIRVFAGLVLRPKTI